MKILIAEDELSIARALKVLLEKNKYSVDAVYDGAAALDYILSTHEAGSGYDALVLDIMMPKMDGLEALRKVRQKGIFTPALFLTAKSEIEDRVAGLDAGADDYLPKPFASAEFLARVRALCRRSSSYAPSILTYEDLSLDCGRYNLLASGETLRLNNKEFQLMELFMRNPHQLFSSEHLMERIWGTDSESEIDVVWTHIGFLRKKLRQLKTCVEIKTIRGAGYALESTKQTK